MPRRLASQLAGALQQGAVLVGVLLLLAGWTALRLALALQRLPGIARSSLSPLSAAMLDSHAGGVGHAPGLPTDAEGPTSILYVRHRSAPPRTRSSAAGRSLDCGCRPQGTVSTGRAALGLEPDLYISHYSETEQESSQSDSSASSARRPIMTCSPLPAVLPAPRSRPGSRRMRRLVFHRFDAARLRAH